MLAQAVQAVQLVAHQVPKVHQEPQVEVIVPLLVNVQYISNTGHQPHHHPPHHQSAPPQTDHQLPQLPQLLLIVQAFIIVSADIYTTHQADPHPPHHQSLLVQGAHHPHQEPLPIIVYQEVNHLNTIVFFIVFVVLSKRNVFSVLSSNHITILSCVTVAHKDQASQASQVHQLPQDTHCQFHKAVGQVEATHRQAHIHHAALQYTVQVDSAAQAVQLVQVHPFPQLFQFLAIVPLLVRVHFTNILYPQGFNVKPLFIVRLL